MPQVLTAGRPWRVILRFAVPLLVGNVVQQGYQMTDAAIVGRTLGVDALAAVGATGSLLFLLIGFAWGMTSGFAIPTAQAVGAGDAAGVRRSVAAGVMLTAIASVVLTALALGLTRPALSLLQTPPELMDQATTFATVTFAGGVATMFYNFLAAVVRAIGDSRTPLVFLTIACVLNGLLAVLLVRVVGMGVGGAALATVTAQAVSVGLCLAYIRRRLPVLHVHRDDFRAARQDLAEHLRIGLPMGFQASIIAIGTLAVQFRLNELGADAVAGYTTATRVDGLAVALLGSLGLAVSTFTAQNHGAQRPDRIRLGVRQGLVIAVVASVLLGATLIALGRPIIRVFVGSGEDQVVDLAVELLKVNGTLYWSLGVLFVLRGALQGLGRALVPTVTGVIELVMRVGASLLLGAVFGYAGVIWGNPLAWLGAVVVLVPAYLAAQRAMGPAPAQEPLLLEGPAEGSAVVEAVVPAPRTSTVDAARTAGPSAVEAPASGEQGDERAASATEPVPVP